MCVCVCVHLTLLWKYQSSHMCFSLELESDKIWVCIIKICQTKNALEKAMLIAGHQGLSHKFSPIFSRMHLAT
jgi:hypothetical protein